MSSIDERLLAVIDNETGWQGKPICLDTTLDDLEIDSLGKLEIAIAIEDEFGVWLDDDKIQALETVQDILDLPKDAGAK